MKKILALFSLSLVFTIGMHAQPAVNLTSTDVACYGDSNGQIVIEVFNGIPEYSYSMNGGPVVNLPSLPDFYDWIYDNGSAGEDSGFGIDYDSAGNVYVGGYFRNTVLIGTDTLISAGETDAFLAKFDSLGNAIWARSGGSPSFEQTNSVAVDDSGNVYTTGFFQGTAIFSGAAIVSGSGSYDIFVVKYDNNGNLQGVVSLGGSQDDQGRFVDTDADGNLYLVGEYRDAVASGPNVITSTGLEDVVIAKFDPSLSVMWLESGGGTQVDRVYEMQVKGDEIVFTGQYSQTSAFGGSTITALGGQDIYVTKYDTSGAFLWVQSAGGLGDDIGRGLAIDGNNNVVCSGYTQGGTFGSTIVSSVSGSWDVFVSQLDGSGAFQWTNTYGGDLDDFGLSVSIDAQNNIFHTGLYAGSAAFSTDSISVAGNWDVFVAKMDDQGTHKWVKSSGGSGVDSGNRIATTSTGVSYLTGSFSNSSATFDNHSISSFGLGDFFVTKLLPIDSTADTLVNLAPGNYSFVVTDGTGTTMDTIEIMQPDSITLTAVASPATGSTGTNGSIDLTVSGGTPGFTYLWSDASITEDISGLMTGTYTVTVTDMNGCTNSIPVFIDTIAPFLAILDVMDVTCDGFDNGSIDLTVSGGTAPFTFLWSNSATTEDLVNVAAGTYTVTVTDALALTTTGSDAVAFTPQFPIPTTDTINGPSTAQPLATYLYNVVATNGSSYSWSVLGGNINSTNSNNVSIAWGAGPTGLITMIETNSFGCQLTVTLLVQLEFTSIDDPKALSGIKLFPNPVNDQLHFSGTAQKEGNLRLNILDLSGRLVSGEMLQLQAGYFDQVLDVSSLAPGLYLLEAEDNSIPTIRFIVQ